MLFRYPFLDFLLCMQDIADSVYGRRSLIINFDACRRTICQHRVSKAIGHCACLWAGLPEAWGLSLSLRYQRLAYQISVGVWIHVSRMQCLLFSKMHFKPLQKKVGAALESSLWRCCQSSHRSMLAAARQEATLLGLQLVQQCTGHSQWLVQWAAELHTTVLPLQQISSRCMVLTLLPATAPPTSHSHCTVRQCQ